MVLKTSGMIDILRDALNKEANMTFHFILAILHSKCIITGERGRHGRQIHQQVLGTGLKKSRG